MVAGGNMTGSRYKESYCGVVNIGIFRTSLFLGNINDLEMTATYVGNAYLCGLRRRISTWWQGIILMNGKARFLFVQSKFMD